MCYNHSSLNLGSWDKMTNNNVNWQYRNKIKRTINPVGVFPSVVNWLMVSPVTWFTLPWQRARNLYFTFREKYRNNLNYLASCYCVTGTVILLMILLTINHIIFTVFSIIIILVEKIWELGLECKKLWCNQIFFCCASPENYKNVFWIP